MDATGDRVYEDFVPPHDMATEPATHASVDLSGAGYKKEHIKVQMARSQGLVAVRGERPVAGNRWSRFRVDFRVPDGCDVKGIHARFEGGVVRVTIPGMKAAAPAAVDAAGEKETAAAKTDAAGVQDAVTRGEEGDRARGGGGEEKEDGRVLQKPEQRASAAVKDAGRLDEGAGVGGAEAIASPSRRGYSFLQDRRKLATTVVGVVLVLISLGTYIRYSFGP